MTGYSIYDLERLSGVKAHTIRIWEKRYELLKPERTSTNIRRYSDDDLKKLLNVSVLADYGVKISNISDHSGDQLRLKVIALLDQPDAGSTIYKAYFHTMISAAMNYNEAEFEKCFSECVLKLGFYVTIRQIVYPVLKRIGIMWRVDQLYPAQEHFLSCIVSRKLHAATDLIKMKKQANEVTLLFLHEEEQHDIPLLFTNYLLRSHGIKTLYLGARVPLQNLKTVVATCHPSRLLTFFTTKNSESFFADYLKSLKKIAPGSEIVFGGNNFFLNTTRLPPGVRWMNSIEAFEKDILSLMPQPAEKKILPHAG